MDRRARHAPGGSALLLAALACFAACTSRNPAYYPDPRPAPPADAATDAPAPPPPPDVAGADLAAVIEALASDDAAMMPPDAATRPPDVAPPPDLPPDAWPVPSGCGSERAELAGLDGLDGIVVASDGTLYFTTTDGTDAWIGRWPAGGTLEREWIGILGAPVTWGLAYDGARRRLYVASASGSAIVAFQLGSTITGVMLAANVPEPNDVAVAPDGAVYYSEQRSGHVYRVAAAGGTPQRVSVGAFSQAPAGLAFAADGSLYVGLRAGGGIWRLLLDAAGTERGRERFGSAAVWANGLAFDRAGRLYVATYSEQTPGPVLRFQPDGSAPVEVLTGGRFASLAFGRGRLDCFDLYATEPFGRFHRVRVDVPGLPLP